MLRKNIEARPNWKSTVSNQGLTWATVDNKPYWNETSYYEFSESEIDEFIKASEHCHQLYIEATEYLIQNPNLLTEKFNIPNHALQAVIDSWNNEADKEELVKCLNYGRFDFGYNGTQLKLFEYNCDTPTSLIEAAIIQHYWYGENSYKTLKHSKQFNSIWESFVAGYKRLKVNKYLSDMYGNNIIHFSYVGDSLGEDVSTCALHMDMAKEAGIDGKLIPLPHVGINFLGDQLVDDENRVIKNLFHLYPIEWMLKEQYGKKFGKLKTLFLEPLWKAIWSNKAMLPILYQLFPNDEYLLEASFYPLDKDYVEKPILSREGANIKIVKYNQIDVQTDGMYDSEPKIYQALFDLPNFNGSYPILGLWMVNGYCVGLGIREDDSKITGNTSRFVPHIYY